MLEIIYLIHKNKKDLALNNLEWLICQKTQSNLVRVDLEIQAMKGYSTFLKASGLEPHHQMQFCVISRTLIYGEGFYHSVEIQLSGLLLLEVPIHLFFFPFLFSRIYWFSVWSYVAIADTSCSN